VIVEIEVDGRTRRVTIEPDGSVDRTSGRFRILIDSPGVTGTDIREALEIDVRRSDLGYSIVESSGASWDVALTAGEGGAALVQLPHVDVQLTIDRRRQSRRRDGTPESGEERIVSAMPGRILRVLVAAGELVEPGRAVVVIEAMKMENELKVTRAGTVREVLVSEGASVEAGRLLVVVA
jgi:biotin carboxyl carrier protein